MTMDKTGKKLQIQIITPSGISHSCESDLLTAPAVMGTVGILPNHIPLFTKLEPGEIKIKTGGINEYIAITGGFMDVNSSSRVTILTDSAQRSEEIDEKRAEKAKEEAEKLLKDREKLSEKEFAVAENSLRKALLDLKVSRKRKIKKLP